MSNYATSSMLRFLLPALLMLSSLALPGQTNFWENTMGDGLWSTDGNWSEGMAPTSSHDVRFNNNNSSDDCTIDVSPTVKSLEINANYLGNVNLGGNTLAIAGDFGVPTATQFTAGMGSKVAITENATVNSAASVYDFEINTAQTTHNVTISQDLAIANDLTIIQIDQLNGSGNKLKVGADIILNDADLDGNSIISATGASSTISGTQLRNLNVEAGASLALLSDITLNNNFALTGSGNITGANKLIFSGSGTVNFSGTVPNVEINTSLAGQTVTLSQNLNISGGLKIIQVGSIAGGTDKEVQVDGDITVDDGDVGGNHFIVATGNGNLSGIGALRRLKVDAGASLQLSSDFTLNNNFELDGSGTITGANKLIFGSNGTVDFSGTVSNVEISTATAGQNVTFSQNFNIAGDLEITQAGTLNGGSDKEVRVSGDITATDSGLDGTSGNAATLVLAGNSANSFQGTGGGSYRHFAVDKDNAADIAQLNSSDAFLSITVKNGALSLNGQNPSAPVTVNSGGTLGGSGTITGDVICDAGGKVSPGDSPGTLTITGNITINGTLEMEIIDNMAAGSGTAGTHYDRLNVSGNASVTTLSVLFLGTITPPDYPATGEVYTLLSVGGTEMVSSTGYTPININAAYASGAVTIGSPALPITLTYFSATPKAQAIHLTWRTATEHNNDYIAVEHSADGAKFTELGRVKGAGTTEEPQAYRFVDEHPLRGLNYYRLRQVDFDGAFEYHKTISVLFDGKRQGLGIQAWPNPVQGQLQATWAAASDQATTLQVLDMTGRKLAEYQAAAGVSTFELPLDGLPAGLYFLKARQGQEEEVVRFHKQ